MLPQIDVCIKAIKDDLKQHQEVLDQIILSFGNSGTEKENALLFALKHHLTMAYHETERLLSE